VSTVARAVVVALFLILTVLSGIWLSRTGRPLNVGLSAVHKLISLAGGAFLLVTVLRRSRLVPLSPTEWIAVVVTGLCFVAMVATGGILSSEKPMPSAILRIHQIVPVLATLATGATLYLLLGR